MVNSTVKMKRVNSIGIRFTKGEKTNELLEKIIEDKLGIPAHELAEMFHWGAKRHIVKVSTAQMYKHICDRYIGYPIRVDSTHEIEIDDLSTPKDRIKMTRVPLEMSQRSIENLRG